MVVEIKQQNIITLVQQQFRIGFKNIENKEDTDYYDYLIIKEIFDDSKGTYGYRRIVEGLLLKYGVVMNEKKVLRIMKKYNLMAEYIRKLKKKNKNERIEDNVKPNLLNRNFTTDALNKVWDTDVLKSI